MWINVDWSIVYYVILFKLLYWSFLRHVKTKPVQWILWVKSWVDKIKMDGVLNRKRRHMKQWNQREYESSRRLMEEKEQLKEVSHYSETAYEYVYMWMCLHVFHLSNTLFYLLDSSKIAREAVYSCFKSRRCWDEKI